MKKLVQPKDYVIIDGTDEDWEGSSKFTNVQRIDSFNPPGTLVKAYSDDDGTFSTSKVEKMENRFYNGSAFTSAVCALLSEASHRDINAFLVLRKKVYKNFAKRYAKIFNKMIGVDICFVFGNDIKDNKKLLNTPHEFDMDKIDRNLAIAEGEISKIVRRESERRKKDR